MLAHHDVVEQLARRAEGVRLRPALKTPGNSAGAQPGRTPGATGPAGRAALIVFWRAQTLLDLPAKKKPTAAGWAKAIAARPGNAHAIRRGGAG